MTVFGFEKDREKTDKQDMNFQEESHSDIPASFHQVEDEKHNMRDRFEKLNSQTRQPKPDPTKQLALALFSIGALILLFFSLASLTNGLISHHLAYASTLLLAFFLLSFLLIIAVIIVNILYSRKR